MIFNIGYEQGFKDGANSEYEHDHEVVKAYNDGQAYILDKINTEIKETANKIRNIRNDNLCFFTEQDVLEIIEKYREVSE